MNLLKKLTAQVIKLFDYLVCVLFASAISVLVAVIFQAYRAPELMDVYLLVVGIDLIIIAVALSASFKLNDIHDALTSSVA
jgi:hypothetical protein